MSFPDDLAPLLRPLLNVLTPDDDDFAQAKQRATRVANALKNDELSGVSAWAWGGSVAKGTAIRPVSDLDVICYIDGARWFNAVSGGWLAPDALLTWLEARVSKTLRWQIDHGYLTVSARRRSVEVRYAKEGSVKIDIVPILLARGNQAHGWIPDPTGITPYRSTSIERQLVLIDQLDGSRGQLRDAVRLLKLWRDNHKIPLISYALEVLAMHAAYTQNLTSTEALLWGVLDGLGDDLLLEGVHLPQFFKVRPKCTDAVQVFDPADADNNLTPSMSNEQAKEIGKTARFTLAKLRKAHRYRASSVGMDCLAEAFNEEIS